MSFYKLGIKSDLVYALECMGIENPTPIQKLAIGPFLKGSDLLCEAQTGTGKTLSFLLPLYQKIDSNVPCIQGLVITPTRELAIQIAHVAQQLSDHKPVNILAAYGGQDVNAQLHRLKTNIHLIIGTPGRILDHLRRGSFSLDHVSMLIVDEADQMFHIGFKKEVDAIIEALPLQRQNLCYSATLSHRVDTFAKDYLKNPLTLTAPKQKMTLTDITQVVYETSGRKKWALFLSLLKKEKPSKAIIFCRSRRGADSVWQDMTDAGFIALPLHGDLTQAAREKAVIHFRNDSVQFLIATDVAARGLDIQGVTHVFNYNLPDDPENYVHRIGRTGRAGKKGVAYTLLTQKDFQRLEAIELFIGEKLQRIQETS